jgi:hypothetical protein
MNSTPPCLFHPVHAGMTPGSRTFGGLARKGLLTLGLSWMALSASAALAEPMALLDRNGSRVAVEPYAPNIVRVTIALDPALASAAPGGPMPSPTPPDGRIMPMPQAMSSPPPG